MVHLAGWPADMHSIRKLADSYGLPIIEDCSQAHGASIEDKKMEVLVIFLFGASAKTK